MRIEHPVVVVVGEILLNIVIDVLISVNPAPDTCLTDRPIAGGYPRTSHAHRHVRKRCVPGS